MERIDRAAHGRESATELLAEFGKFVARYCISYI